uniref:alpha-taxilin-like n=1 Tax=Arvicanthis niloticus TaxID=61156 RepID=UPI001485E8BC|nr:alpha-taxilin-like [Arvicanthis niloticus]
MKNHDIKNRPAKHSNRKSSPGPQEAGPEGAHGRARRLAPGAEAEGSTSQAPEMTEGAQAKAAPSGIPCDISEEMFQQLKDIPSTYRMDNNQGGLGEEGAQGEAKEPEDTEKPLTYEARNGEPESGVSVVRGEKETSNGEPGTEEIGASDEVEDQDHRRPQEKKKIRDLGKEILNALNNPEEKLAALCKKYAIKLQMEQHNDPNYKLCQDNTKLAERLTKLIEQYELREELIYKIFKHKDLQQQLTDIKLQKTQEKLKEAEEQHEQEKEFLLKEVQESQRMCEVMKQQGIHLKHQLTMYKEKFEEFQSTLSESNEMFIRFKQEIEKMSKKIKKLEKENTMYQSRWESSKTVLLQMAEEKTLRDKELEGLQVKIQRLEKLCRGLQTERNDLNKRVQDLTARGQGSLTDIGFEQRPEAATTPKEPDAESPGAQPSSSPRATDDPGCPGAPSTETAGQTGPKEPSFGTA